MRHSALRQAEGWDVFSADGSSDNVNGDWPLQLSRLDEVAILTGDDHAMRVCVAGAKEGRAHALSALQMLRDESRPELMLTYRIASGEDCTSGDIPGTDCSDRALDEREIEIFNRVVTHPRRPS